KGARGAGQGRGALLPSWPVGQFTPQRISGKMNGPCGVLAGVVCRGLTASDVPMTLILSQIAASRGPMAAFVAMGVVWGVFMASMPDLKAGLGVSDGQLGRLLLAGSVMAITMMLLAPRLGGWLGRAAVP